MTRATALNMRQKDAPHFYISWSLHPDSGHRGCYAISIVPNRDDFLPQDVIGKWRHTMLQIESEG